MGKKGVLLVILLVIFFIGFVNAATFSNVVSSCAAEDSATKGSFGSACDVAGGASLQTDDGASLETHTYAKSSYGGVRVESVNSSITSCSAVTQVFVCYEWWRTATATPQDCDVSVDADGGISYSLATTTCPGTTANPGVVCTNVTALESWTCDGFFGPSGTRALAKSELSRIGTGAATTETGTWDVLYFNVTYSAGNAPTLSNITLSSSLLAGGSTLTIYANSTSNGLNDADGGTLGLYCSNVSTPNATNTLCTAGTLSDTSYPYDLTCSYSVALVSKNETIYCRAHDGALYSTVTSANYTIDADAPTLSIISVAGDTIPSYYDAVDDSVTSVNVSGEAGMSCRWSASDVAYSSMISSCAVDSIYAICNFTSVSQGLTTRYIACQDSLGNGNNVTNNLNVEFTLDYTAPTTYDNSDSSFHVPNYLVTITELDNADSDPTTYYCTDTVGTCTPATLIDNGGTVTFTSANRGRNYLRYYSVDDAGNIQTTVNKTININQIPIFSSATDNATTIKGGWVVNVSTVSFDSDSDLGQGITLFVCDTPSATSSGCTSVERCTDSGIANLSCTFTSELDSATHNWYAYIFDDLGEAATNNPLPGSYITDYTAPTITIISPSNTTYTASITAEISLSEIANWSAYSINDSTNVTLTRISGTLWSSVVSGLSDGFYNISFYANDSYGNMNKSGYVYVTIDSTANDTQPPLITVVSPDNVSYYTSADVLLNITSNEDLAWAGYSVNGSAISDLDNTSTTSWNMTYTFVEGTNTILFYANDTSSNQNQANKTILIYVDLTAPTVSSFSCNTTVNDSDNVTCSASVSDAVSLSNATIGYNTSGSFTNSSSISLSGTSDTISYTILSGNTTPGGFNVTLYMFDSAGYMAVNYTTVSVLDDTAPVINNISYSPNTTDALDDGVNVTINASITEDYSISSVEVFYKNISDSSWTSISMTNTTALDYNVTINFSNGNWTFYVNATDSQGNSAVSQNYTLNVSDDISQNIATTILSTQSYTYAQRSDANNLGYLVLNNTGDGSLDFNVSISVDDAINISRFDINGTTNQSQNYSVSSGDVANLAIYVNTTDLTVNVYYYNITVFSAAGSETFERSLNIQAAVGPYLSVSIISYPSSVTRGDSDQQFIATVTNLGTATASGVYLNWTLPEGFSLSTGGLNRSLGSLGVGISGTNTISVDISSSIGESSVLIYANVSSTDADSVYAYKNITVRDPLVITSTITTTTGGGGGGAGASAGGGGAEVYAKTIEVVRGNKTSFFIDFKNKYVNKSLQDVVLSLSGYPEQYLQINPSSFDYVGYGENRSFEVLLNAPSYKSYEEYSLKAIISGTLVYGTTKQNYKEIQNIKLIIQEISREESLAEFELATGLVDEMEARNYSVIELRNLLSEADDLLNNQRHNKDSYDLSAKVIDVAKTAFEARELIDLIKDILINPRNVGLLTGNVVASDSAQNAIFYSSAISDVLSMAEAAFDRGDYSLALERAQKAEFLLRLEQKGNVFIFVYLYWPQIIFVLFLISILGRVGYKQYSKRNVSAKIKDYDNEEDNINKLITQNQKNYYSGKISSSDYHNRLSQYNSRLAVLRKSRINLRNKRIKVLAPEQVDKELESEKKEVEKEIVKLQTDFYKKKKIPESNYRSNFDLLNSRLAEIEDEKIVVDMGGEEKKASKKRFSFFKKWKEKKEKKLKDKIEETIRFHGVKK